MVGRLVKYQQVGLCQQYVGQCHSLLLTTTQLPHGLLQIANLQLGQYLFSPQHLLWVALMIEAGVKHSFLRVEDRRLLQHAHLQVTTEDDATTVIAFLAREYRQQCRLTRTILGYQSHLLPLANREADVAEQLQGTKRFR